MHAFAPIENKVVQIIRYENEDIVSACADLLSEGGVIGIIVNTVKRAQRLPDYVPSDSALKTLRSCILPLSHRPIEKEARLIQTMRARIAPIKNHHRHPSDRTIA